MRALFLSGALILAGCSTVDVPKTINIPVPVPCRVEMPTAPEARYSPPYDNIFEAVRDLLGDRELAQAYENELRIALKSCM